MSAFLQIVVDQARDELGTDKSMEAVETYINGMNNMALLGLIERAADRHEVLSTLEEVE